MCLRDIIKFFSCLCVLCLGTFVCVLLLFGRGGGGGGVFLQVTKQFVDRIQDLVLSTLQQVSKSREQKFVKYITESNERESSDQRAGVLAGLFFFPAKKNFAPA